MSSEALNQRFIHVPFSALIASVCAHIALVLAFVTVKVLDYYGIHLFPHQKKLEVYQQFIQVDVVGLPNELMGEKHEMDPTLPVVDNPKTVTDAGPKTDPDETEKKQKEDEDLMAEKQKAEEKAKEAQKAKEEKQAKEKEKKEREKALKKLQEDASREAALKALQQTKNGKAGRGKIAGNILSKGTAMTGAIGTAKDRYQALVSQKIKEHFKVYPWQRKKGLVAVVSIDLLPNGRVRGKKIVKASADTLYNTAVLQAIDEAQPLPIPEDKSLISDGITIEFRPEE